MPERFVREVMEEMADTAGQALEVIGRILPADFPEFVHRAVKVGVTDRLSKIRVV